jgi:hypothetical protein
VFQYGAYRFIVVVVSVGYLHPRRLRRAVLPVVQIRYVAFTSAPIVSMPTKCGKRNNKEVASSSAKDKNLPKPLQ